MMGVCEHEHGNGHEDILQLDSSSKFGRQESHEVKVLTKQPGQACAFDFRGPVID